MMRSHNTEQQVPDMSVYEQVADSTHAYFGADAANYVGRLIEIHTRKQSASLSKSELMSLLDWIKAAATFFAEDKEKLDEYIAKLFAIAAENSTSSDT